MSSLPDKLSFGHRETDPVPESGYDEHGTHQPCDHRLIGIEDAWSRGDGKRSDRRGKLLARIIHECRREAFETEVRRGFSHARPAWAYSQPVEKAEREESRRASGSDDGADMHE